MDLTSPLGGVNHVHCQIVTRNSLTKPQFQEPKGSLSTGSTNGSSLATNANAMHNHDKGRQVHHQTSVVHLADEMVQRNRRVLVVLLDHYYYDYTQADRTQMDIFIRRQQPKEVNAGKR